MERVGERRIHCKRVGTYAGGHNAKNSICVCGPSMLALDMSCCQTASLSLMYCLFIVMTPFQGVSVCDVSVNIVCCLFGYCYDAFLYVFLCIVSQ